MSVTPARTLRLATAALAALGLTALAAAPAHAAVQPAGLACDFPLDIVGDGGALKFHQHGDVIMFTGRGENLTLTNVDTSASLSLRSKGVAVRVTQLPDDASRYELNGSNIVILFPTDVPAGPSTTLYNGRVVFHVDADAVWTLESFAGPTRDLCAELS